MAEHVYEIEITKSTTKTIKVTTDKPIDEDELRDWADDYCDELYDIESYQGDVKLDPDDLIEGGTVAMTARETEEYGLIELEGVCRVPS